MSANLDLFQGLLEALFSDTELRILARDALADGPGIQASLPGHGASARDIAAAVVLLTMHHYGRPPRSMWDYLLRVRERRASEIRAVWAAFASDSELPAEEPPVASNSGQCGAVGDDSEHPLRLTERLRGTCDLVQLVTLAGLTRSAQADRRSGPSGFTHLVAGRVNGLPRTLVLSWTESRLGVQATPSLYRGAVRLPAVLDLPLPIHGEEFSYFPCGQHHMPAGSSARLRYTLTVDEWSPRRRAICLTDEARRRLPIEFPFP